MPRISVPLPVLATARLLLRPFRLDDTDAMHGCYGDGEAMRFWNRPAHTRRSQTERVVRRCMVSVPARRRVWAVALRDDDACVGMVNYHNADLRNRNAEIGYFIHPAHHRQGIAAEAVGALLDHCFATLGLHRVQAVIDPDNEASRALAGRLGFRCEGMLRETMFLGGAWRNDLVYGLLRREWAGMGGRGDEPPADMD